MNNTSVSSYPSFGSLLAVRSVSVNGITYKDQKTMYEVTQALSHLLQKAKSDNNIKQKIAQITPDYFIKEGWQPVSVMRTNRIDKKVNLLTGEDAFRRKNIYQNKYLTPQEKSDKAAEAINYMMRNSYLGHIAIEAEKITTTVNKKLKEVYRIIDVHKTV